MRPDEEAAAAEAVADVQALADQDDAVDEAGAAAAIADLNATVAADEAALEASAATEIDRLADAAAANEANEPAATEDVAQVVEAVATQEAMDGGGGRRDRRSRSLAAVADDEATEADATADQVATIDDAVADDEATEEAAAGDAIETIIETVAADEAVEEADAAEAIKEIARETDGGQHRRLTVEPRRQPTTRRRPAGRFDFLTRVPERIRKADRVRSYR